MMMVKMNIRKRGLQIIKIHRPLMGYLFSSISLMALALSTFP